MASSAVIALTLPANAGWFDGRVCPAGETTFEMTGDDDFMKSIGLKPCPPGLTAVVFSCWHKSQKKDIFCMMPNEVIQAETGKLKP